MPSGFVVAPQGTALYLPLHTHPKPPVTRLTPIYPRAGVTQHRLARRPHLIQTRDPRGMRRIEHQFRDSPPPRAQSAA